MALPDGNVGYVRIYSRRLLFVNRTMVSFILSVGNRQLVETRMEKETTISYNAYKKMWRKLLLAYKRKVAHGNDV